jgi:hypothetical protein
MKYQRWRVVGVVLLAACMLFLLHLPGLSSAQTTRRCFAETSFCVSGRMLEYWERNGGLPVFGYPISPVETRVNRETGRSSFVQWFERHRLELYPGNVPPYDVLLGRIGVERLDAQGVDWQSHGEPVAPQPGCLWFEATQHNVCDQVPGFGFQTYWESYGLQDPALDSYGRSLALFGLPLTEAYMATAPDGQRVLTQWFERARFEWHPRNPPPYNVLLGLLGRESLSAVPVARRTDGLWQGRTSQWERLLFSVEDGAIRLILSDVLIRGEDCETSYLYTRSSFTPEGIARVDGPSFAVAIEDNEALFTMVGTFESDTIASGTLEVTTKPGVPFACVGSGAVTWRAERQVPEPPSTGTTPPPPAAPTPLPQLPNTSVDATPEPASPTADLCRLDPSPTEAADFPVRIVEVDKKAEVVTLENVSPGMVDLTGWTMCSLNGDQVHTGVSGTIEPGETRRLLHNGTIWLNDERDDGALYDNAGNLISYWNDRAN